MTSTGTHTKVNRIFCLHNKTIIIFSLRKIAFANYGLTFCLARLKISSIVTIVLVLIGYLLLYDY